MSSLASSPRRALFRPGVHRKEVLAWATYDFANSGYTTVVLTAIYNAFFVGVVAGGANWATLAWTAVISVSNLLGVLLMPFIGARADIRASKKLWLALMTALCVVCTAGLAFTGPGTLALAALLIVVSNFAFNAGVALNSAFLSELANPQSYGKVSGWGWSFGYLGGILTLGLCLAVVLPSQSLGIGAEKYVPWCMLVTAALFAIAALPMFLCVKERAKAQKATSINQVIQQSSSRLKKTLDSLPIFRDFAWLSLSCVFYHAGIAVVITLAAVYAQEVMGFSHAQSILLILCVNFTAAAGAFLFGYLQDFLGHKATLSLTIVLWIVMVAIAGFCTSISMFWFAANLAGIAMGSSQSAGRAMVAVLAPAKRLAEFYSFWNVAVWVAAIIGPLTYGLVTWLTGGDQRQAILVTGLYFIFGLLCLIPVNMRRGEETALQDVD